MKKKIIGLLVVTTFILFTGCSHKQTEGRETKNVTINDVLPENRLNTDANYWEYSFEELQEVSDVIVKVQVTDELSLNNSREVIDSNGDVAYGCSVRQVTPIKFYKNALDIDEDASILVQDDAAIREMNGKYYFEAINDTVPLVQGDTYILYLQKQDHSFDDSLVIISGDSGKIHLDNPYENNCDKAIIDKTLEKYK